MSENLEWAVLAGVLQKPSLLIEIDLVPEDFTTETHSDIFQAIIDLESSNTVIDFLTVSEHLENKTNRSWMQIVAEIVKNGRSLSNVLHYAKSLREASQQRQAAAIAEMLMDNAKEGQSAVDTAIRELMKLNATKKNHACTLSEALRTSLDNMQSALDETQGVKTGFNQLDNCLGGFQKTDLYVIGARPAMGKTALLINMANGSDVSCGFISAEQAREQIGLRLISVNGRVPAAKLRSAKMQDHEWAQVTNSLSHMQNKKIFLYDKPAPTITDVLREARRLKFQNDIQILYVDYIQRIKATDLRVPKHEQLEEVVQGLKELARELEIPVVALAQVNRAVETRDNKRPSMSDLKGSGAIEQEADNIMTLYRDEVYNKQSEDKGYAELSVMKNRHGPTGMFKINWTAPYMKFDDEGIVVNE